MMSDELIAANIVRDIRQAAETYPEVFQVGFIRDKATEYRAVAMRLNELAVEFEASVSEQGEKI